MTHSYILSIRQSFCEMFSWVRRGPSRVTNRETAAAEVGTGEERQQGISFHQWWVSPEKTGTCGLWVRSARTVSGKREGKRGDSLR